MRIVMLAPFGIRPKGTLAVRMLPLAQALTRRGHDLTIVAPPVHNPDDAGRRDRYDGVPVIHTTLRGTGVAATLAQAVAIARTCATERPEIIHLFKPKGYSGLAALLLQVAQPGVPLVVDTDDWEGPGGWNDLLPYPRAAKALFAWQERDLPRRARAVTAASRTLESLIWAMGVPRQRVFYLPNGSPGRSAAPPAHSRPDGPPTLLLYTRFWEFDVRDIVTALTAIIGKCPTARLRVIGRGERGEEQELLRLAARAGVAHAIDYRGWVEPASIPALLTEADLALVPLDDTLINRARCSAKLLELMAAGLPIVAARVGQTAEYLDEESGVLVPPSQPGALACAVVQLINDPHRRAQLSAGARRAASAWSWDALAPIAERAYRTATHTR